MWTKLKEAIYIMLAPIFDFAYCISPIMATHHEYVHGTWRYAGKKKCEGDFGGKIPRDRQVTPT